MTLWGKPEQVHVQNMEHLHAILNHQNPIENSIHATSGHELLESHIKKYMYMLKSG